MTHAENLRLIGALALAVVAVAACLALACWFGSQTNEMIAKNDREFEGVLKTLRTSYDLLEAKRGRETSVNLKSLGEFETYAARYKVSVIFYGKYVTTGGGCVWFLRDGVIYYYSIP